MTEFEPHLLKYFETNGGERGTDAVVPCALTRLMCHMGAEKKPASSSTLVQNFVGVIRSPSVNDSGPYFRDHQTKGPVFIPGNEGSRDSVFQPHTMGNMALYTG